MRRWSFVSFLASGTLLAGCGLVLDLEPQPADPDGGAIQRLDGAPAPDASAADAGGGDAGDAGDSSDAGGPSDAGACPHPPAPWTEACGGPTALIDDFTDGVDPERWGRSFGLDPSTAGGPDGLVVAPDANGSLILASSFAIDLRDDWVAVEVPQPAEGAGASTVLGLRFEHLGEAVVVRMAFRDGQLRLSVRSSGSLSFGTSVDYDPSADRWWRIREASGSLFFETSADGGCWRPRAETAAPPFVAHLWVELGVNSGVAGVTAPAIFGGVNHDPLRGAEPWCEASSFADDFEDGFVAPGWFSSHPTCDASEREGQLQIIAGAGAICEVHTRTAYSLVGQTVTFRFESVTTVNTGASLVTWLRDGGGDFLAVGFDGIDLQIATSDGGMITSSFIGWPVEVGFSAATGSTVSVRAENALGEFQDITDIPTPGLDTTAVSIGAGLDARRSTVARVELAIDRYQ